MRNKRCAIIDNGVIVAMYVNFDFAKKAALKKLRQREISKNYILVYLTNAIEVKENNNAVIEVNNTDFDT